MEQTGTIENIITLQAKFSIKTDCPGEGDNCVNIHKCKQAKFSTKWHRLSW